ncbi:MAG: T9SS type A sorting domain-containing protein [Bacteroidales bacterium]|nr:T9SS type A sorting domain-containing protein [Bacteroidales bacterium]
MAPSYKKTTIFKFMGDSTWDGKKYMKVYMTTDSSLVKWDVHGLIREDSTHKVFYKSPDKEQEELMYDFNAKIGDSLFIPPNFVDDPILVCSIDTVELGGVKRKRYKLARQFCSDQPQDLWIEGIGSLLGILNSNRVGAIGVYISLLCFYENAELIYTNPKFDSCYYISTGIFNHSVEKITIDIIPNPVSNVSFITINPVISLDMKLEIYDIHGRLRMVKTFDSSGKCIIRQAELYNGIYFYRVIINKNMIKYGKIMVL